MKTTITSKKSWVRLVPNVKNKSLVLILFLTFLSVRFGYATDYYFSTSTGIDSRTTAEAQNAATPWKSIDKLNAIASSLKGGDRILFKAGEVFYGTIKIAASGVAGSPILFTSYGTGAKPVITSLVRVQNWVSLGNGKYQADLSAYNLSRVQVVLINDQIKEIGRYPNAGTSNGGYLKIASVNSSTSFNTQTANPFTGAVGEVVVRKNNWIIDRHAIENISGSTISFKPNESVYSPLKDYGYFLQNHASLLDNSGEWSYDPVSKKLTVNLSGFDINTVNVMASTLDFLVTNNAYTTNLSFSNLNFKGSNTHLFNISRSENVKIENSVLEFAGENAIASFDIKGLVVQNNQINYSFNSAIHLRYGTPGAIIRGNTIQNTMPFQGMSRSSDLNGIGIFLASDGDGSLIEKNNVINTGYNAIHFGGSYSKVVNNFIDGFCLYKQDGGGIYMNSDGLRDRNNIGREITGNIVLNGIGTKLGTMEDVDIAEGIYLDDNTAGVKVSKNTIAHVSGKGVLLHNANNIQITDNLFYKAKSQVQFTHDFMGDPIRNISVTQNQFSSMEKTDQVYSLFSILDDIGSVGTFTTNYFLDPFKNDFFIYTRGVNDPQTGVSRNLPNWTSAFGFDANAVKPDLNLPTFKITSSTLIKESNFSSSTSIIAGVYGATSQLAASGIDGGTFKINPNTQNNATVYIQIGAIQTGEKILIEFDMKGTPANIPVDLFLEGTFNLDKGASNGKASTSSATKSHQILLSSLTAKSNESIVFRIPPAATEVLLDNIKISKVTTEDIAKESYIFFAYNPTGSAVSQPLDGTYVNAKNEIFSGSVTIPAYGSVLLARTSTVTTPVPNQAPTVSLTKPTEGQIFTLGVNPVELVANALDPEGKIKQVEFYNGTTLLTTVTAAPYSFNWATITAGDYQVTAKVIDEGSLSATSAPVRFSVKADAQTSPAYTALMVSPINNSTVELGTQPVVLKTNATTSGLTIQKVEFFNWGFPLTTVTSGNFEFTWTSIQVDTYNIQAKVTDSKGIVYTTDAVKFSVTAPAVNQAPTVTLSNPTEGQIFTKGVNTVELVANALDPEGKIRQVEFYNGTTLLTTVTAAPYSFNWATITAGDYQVNAKVIDEGNLNATSTAVRFSVKDQVVAYTALMVSPINNSTIEQGTQPVVLKTNASTSGLAIQKVEYFNWGFPLVSVTSGNFEFTWQTILVDNYNITAKVTDSKGIVYTTDAVKFSVTAPAVNQAPTVTLSNPTEGQIFTKGVNTVELVANALDPEGKIKQVEFYNGTTLLSTVTAAPYSFNWATITAGDYQVTAKVTDEGNLNATSTAVKFSVKDQVVAYTALMVSPINNSIIEQGTQQVVLKTNASTSGLAIQKVEYFNWGNLLTTVTSGNFEYPWTSILVDTYNIQAKVTDSKGIVYTTDAVKFSITAPTNTIIVDYTIKVLQPYDNQIFTLGKEAVILKADVKSPATIKSIQFFNYGLPLASDSTFPYEFDWKRIKAGDYQVHAVVTDSNGKTATSNLVKFRVNSSSTKLRTLETSNTLTATTSVEIAQPYDNQIFEFGKDSVILQANTSEKVSKVEFFNWHLPLASVTNDQNQFNWSKIEVGDYLVYARITDSLGKSVESEPILFRVIAPEKKPIEKGDLTRDLQKDTNGYGIKMGPNPTSSELNIFFDDYPENLEGKVSVIDLRGVELFNSDFNTSQATITLDLDFLKPGIYLVRLNFGNKIFQSHKLIKN